MMNQIERSIDELVRRVKRDHRLCDYTFVKGFSAVDYPNPLSGYMIAVSTLDMHSTTEFLGEAVDQSLKGRIETATVKFRVYSPKNDGGEGLLSLCCDLTDAVKQCDTLNVCEDITVSPIAFDNEAKTVYRDIVATLSFCVYEEVSV